MSLNFSAHQYNLAYKAERLCNWEVPAYYPKNPRQRVGRTKVLTDNRGHFLPHVKITDKSPFGHFRGTYQLPDRITQKFIDEYNLCMNRAHKYHDFPVRIVHPCEKFMKKNIIRIPTCTPKCEAAKRSLETDRGPILIRNPCDRKKKN